MTQARTILTLVIAFILGTVSMTVMSGCQPAPAPRSMDSNTTDTAAAPAMPKPKGPPINTARPAGDNATTGESKSDSSTAATAEKAVEKSDTKKEEPASKESTDPTTPDSPAKPDASAKSDTPPKTDTPAKQETTDKPDAAPEKSAAPAPEKTAPPADAATAEVKAKALAKFTPAIDKSANAKIVPGDWAQWGGTSYRNNVPEGKNIPMTWKVGQIDRRTQEWKKEGSKNINWVTRLGSQTYGNPVVADGRVYVGTNNTAGYLKRYPSDVDLGVLLCIRESDGAFLWQHSSEKLPTGRVNDWPLQGICCAPYVEGKRLWYVTSRGEVVCLDAEGFHDGEDDGPLQNELGRLFDVVQNEDPAKDKVAGYVTALGEGKIDPELAKLFSDSGMALPEGSMVKTEQAGKKWTISATIQDAPRQLQVVLVGLSPSLRLSTFKVISPADKDEADRIWVLDMMAKLKISQHNMCSCSVTALGDMLFVNTSNGVDEAHVTIPQVDAPSFICVNKNTGEVYWTDKSPGPNILHGQWSSPTVATLGGVPQVLFGGGDGWLYSFKADQGKDGKPELLWEFDANPKETKYSVDARSSRNHIIATPVVYDGLVYVAVGEDPEHGEGEGHLWCIDPTKRGDVSPQLAVAVADRSKPLPKRRLQAIFPDQGEVAIDNPNSAAVWHFSKYDSDGDGKLTFEETMHRTCGTVTIKNDLLFIADFSGLFHCLDAKSGKLNWTYDMLAAAWSSPLIVGDKVYIGDEDGDIAVFNLTAEKHVPVSEINMQNSVYTTPIVANDTMFIANKTHLFAIAAEKEGQ